jgi:hypothetical protein
MDTYTFKNSFAAVKQEPGKFTSLSLRQILIRFSGKSQSYGQ